MREGARLLGVAVQFLTRLPMPTGRADASDLRRSVGAFPAVGLLVGAVGVAVRAVAEIAWPRPGATVMAVAAMVLITGAFHEDGLADTADGLWGGWSPERRIEIMRDSRLGTYGTLALVLTLGVRVSLLVGLDLPDFARAALVGHVLGRASTLLLVRLSRPLAGGSGALVAGGGVGAGGLLAAGVVVGGTVFGALGVAGILPLAVGTCVTVGSAGVFNRRLGGVNGDALGAANQLVHVATMATVVALVGT